MVGVFIWVRENLKEVHSELEDYYDKMEYRIVDDRCRSTRCVLGAPVVRISDLQLSFFLPTLHVHSLDFATVIFCT